MGEFPTLAAFLEHISLVMDVENADAGPRVSIMTLHAAKGLEFEVVFLPGWEEGLFPHQRSLDDNGAAGLEEERRLAYVGVTRARRKVAIYFAANRRVRGLWQSSLPSRFIDELPEDHVEVAESGVGAAQNYPPSRFDEKVFSTEGYQTAGWRRAQEYSQSGAARPRAPEGPARNARTLEGHAIALDPDAPTFKAGMRIFHAKFGPGDVYAVDGRQADGRFRQGGPKNGARQFRQRHLRRHIGTSGEVGFVQTVSRHLRNYGGEGKLRQQVIETLA